MGYPVPLTTEDWARVRYEYECTNHKVVEICAEHGISAGTLRDRVRRWGWTRRWCPVPRQGPPAMAVFSLPAPQSRFTSPTGSGFAGPAQALGGEVGSRSDPGEGVQVTEMDEPPHPDPLPASGERESRTNDRSPPILEDGRERPVVVHDARPIGERLQGAIAQVMPALETTLASLAAGPMQPRAMEQAARALGSLTRTLRELHGLVAQHDAQRCAGDAGDDTCEDVEELRERLSRQIDALIEEEREARPRRYLAAWEEFAAEAANPAAVTVALRPRPAASSKRTTPVTASLRA